MGLCGHPHDLFAELIAREFGVNLTNEHVHDRVAPLLIAALKRRDLLRA